MTDWKEIKDNWTVKGRVYVLKGEFQPPLRQIRSAHSYANHLMHWDDKIKENRELRYFAAAKSPFVDEQPEKGVVVEHIFFRDGMLVTNEKSIALQQFLAIHPDNGRIFEELVPEQDAEMEIEDFEARAEAYKAVDGLSIDEIEAIMLHQNGHGVFTTSSKELRRDLWILADEQPETLLAAIDNPKVENDYIAVKAQVEEIISISGDRRSVSWKGTKKKICTAGVDETAIGALSNFFTTDDGIAVKDKIKERLEKK